MPGLRALLAYAKYLGPAPRAYTLSGRTLVLHSDSPWILDLNLFSAFHAICLHLDLLFACDLSLRITSIQRLVNSLSKENTEI